jgi:hypothetical protein
MSAVHALEEQLSSAKEFIARREMALRLARNPDFKKLILEEFCIHECARYAQASADPSLDATARADSLSLAQAPGHLRRWLQVINQMGQVAERDIEDLETSIEAARQEEGVE